MVDVHFRVAPATLAHHLQEVEERLTLVGTVVRPERGELVGDGQHAPEVFQPPVPAIAGPQRVALEVEEQIPLVGVGQHHQRLGVDDLEGGFHVAVLDDSVGDLQAGLPGERGDGALGQFGDGPVVRGQLVHRADAGVDEPGALAGPHAGDQQQVIGFGNLDAAFGAAEAGAHPVVGPGHRDTAGQVCIEQSLQGLAARPVHREQLVDAVAGDRAVAEHQVDLLGDRDARRGQRVGVGGQLQQRLHLDRAGQLGVAQAVAPAAGAGLQSEKVGETGEPAVEHGGLVDGRIAAADGGHGVFGGRRQPGHRVGGPADHGDVGGLPHLGEVSLLVLEPEIGRAGQQLIVGADAGPPAEAGVEGTQQRVFTPRGGREVGGAVDHQPAGPVV